MPYDYDLSNVEHLRAVVAEQEATIEYLHERCKAEEVENAKLRELMYSRAHRFALQNMTEDELRIVATNLLEQVNKYRELVSVLGLVIDD